MHKYKLENDHVLINVGIFQKDSLKFDLSDASTCVFTNWRSAHNLRLGAFKRSNMPGISLVSNYIYIYNIYGRIKRCPDICVRKKCTS